MQGTSAGGANAHLITLNEMTFTLGDARSSLLVTGGLLAAGVIGFGIAIEAWPPSRDVTLDCLCCLGSVLMAVCWITAAMLLALAFSLVTDALGELRRRTGARVQVSAPWASFVARGTALTDLDPEETQKFIATVAFSYARAQLALRWAIMMASCFCAWTAAMFSVGAFR
jgi:hypothetical protein